MPLARQRQWQSQCQQRALIEFRLVEKVCPRGLYLTVNQNDFTSWNGVFFVRKGPYCSAILRFQIIFPSRYPELAPLVTFNTDVFHPLVTPLTTYTYTTGSSAADPVSATDEERLPPGGLSMRHRFPQWFENGLVRSPLSPEHFGAARLPNGQDRNKRSSWGSPSPRPAAKSHSRKFQSFHIPPPKDEEESQPSELRYSIVEVLRYIKQVFEDESYLDSVPLEGAGNPGAWHAWRAHRSKSLASAKAASRTNTPRKGVEVTGRAQQGGGWNWDGVWADRAKKAIQASQSDGTLFGNVDSEELIHFLDVDGEIIDKAKGNILESTGK